MSHLNQKSEINLKASKLLIDSELYASSVHCSYYAVLQYLICEYANNLNKTFDEIVQESKDGKGTHNYIIKGIINYLKRSVRGLEMVQKNVKETNIQKLNRKINDLKKFRVRSDYRNFEINKDISEKCYNKSNQIIADTKTFLS